MSGIHVLEPIVAKRIAAGEVIDRPAAALRELLDNAIDSGASSLSAEITNGGIDRIRLTDNGSGMDKNDLALCILPHATSKIQVLDDLLSLRSLGFRGEALSSIAAVSRLEIRSAIRNDDAWLLRSEPHGTAELQACSGSKGTSVTIEELFASFPARKQFLKNPSAESLACKMVFIDKAMAFPSIAMRFTANGNVVYALPQQPLLERVLSMQARDISPEFFTELIANGEGYNARIIAASQDVKRNDRRHIQIFVNKRRVQEFALTQAVEYAYRTVLPAGTWPYAYCFIDVDPHKADFNIHPAKKEVRLKNMEAIRAGLMRSIQDFTAFRIKSLQRSLYAPHEQAAHSSSLFEKPVSLYETRQHENETIAHAVAKVIQSAEAHNALSNKSETVERPLASGGSFFYIGQSLGVFLLFEINDELVVLDQHAAHERCLYDEFMSRKHAVQELLVPIAHEPESQDESDYIAGEAETLAAYGFSLRREGRVWLLSAAPAVLPESKTGCLFEVLRKKPESSALIKEIAAEIACKAAVKDGTALDRAAAEALCKAALVLPEPYCPHGRPIWYRLSKEHLFKALKRIV